MVDHNVDLLNHHDLSHSFFCLSKTDPTVGFDFDASDFCGPTYPSSTGERSCQDHMLFRKLVLGSHLARFLRHELESEKGYTAAVGISTNKLLAKLVGNVNKPRSQTTLVPPYDTGPDSESNVVTFMDAHDIGKIPGIGFRLSQKIRAHILGRQPAFEDGLIYGGTKEGVLVHRVRTFPDIGPEMLEGILSGPGSQKGIGGKIWSLIHGVDNTEVSQAKKVPTQISIEDSYIHLDTWEEVKKELTTLSISLIRRMHLDLVEEDHASETSDKGSARRWLAHPRTLRLTTRPRPPRNPDGTRSRSFNRISRSTTMPSFAFSLTENIRALAERLVQDALIPTFKKLHPERSGWNLSLINVAVTNMAETAADHKNSKGRDISRMFQHQEDVLKQWKVADVDMAPDLPGKEPTDRAQVSGDDAAHSTAIEAAALWESDDEAEDAFYLCHQCGAPVPSFALVAHGRFHSLPD